MRFFVAPLLVCVGLFVSAPASAGHWWRHHHHHHHGHHYDDDYAVILGAIGAGVLIYTAGRIHGARSASKGAPAPVAYPAHQQSERRQARDRYECHEWAVRESDFDPARDRRGDIDHYDRALAACLEARGYVVR